MATTINDEGHQLPPELIRKILVTVFADGVHNVCVSRTSVKWEMNIVETLSSVCYAFREIMTDVGRRAFVLPQDDWINVSLGVYKKLEILRQVAVKYWQLRDSEAQEIPTSGFVSYLSIGSLEQSPIFHAYILWMVCGALRVLAARTPDVAPLLKAHSMVVSLFMLGREKCEKVRPRAMAGPLVGVLERDMEGVVTVTALAKARMEMEDSLRLLEDIDKGRDGETGNNNLRQSLQASIDENMRKIENANLFNEERPSVFMTDDIYHDVQLPCLLNALVRCGRAQFEPPEYCETIRLRVDEILVAYVNVQHRFPVIRSHPTVYEDM